MSLSPLGMSGGMDINSMVNKIVDAERVPKQQRIDSERATIESDISAYGKFRDSLDSIGQMMAGFRMDKAFALRKVDSTDDSVVIASASTKAVAGRHSVDVLQLAQSHKLASHPFDDKERFGAGTLQIGFGRKQFDVNVIPGSKVTDVVRAINQEKSNPGVRASVINDNQGQRLIISSDKSGEKHAISMSVISQSDKPLSVDDPLYKLAYETADSRLSRLEQNKQAAIDALKAPVFGQALQDYTEFQQQNIDKIDQLKEELTGLEQAHAEKMARLSQADPSNPNDVTAYGSGSGTKAAQQYAQYQPGTGLDKEKIPGWHSTTAGILNDAYQMSEPRLDPKAISKMNDTPGWNNSASGTLTDSYMTPQEKLEAQQEVERQKMIETNKLEQEKADVVRQFLAEQESQQSDFDKLEKAVLASAIDQGLITRTQASEEGIKALPEDVAEALDKIKSTQQALNNSLHEMEQPKGLVEIKAAQDARVIIDGIAEVNSDDNVIDEALEGVSLTLKDVTKPGSSLEIGVDYDIAGVVNRIEQFVQAYNQFFYTSKELTAVDPITGKAGALAGDSAVRNADAKIKSVLSAPIENAPANLRTLTEFGIASTRNGTLDINYRMLEKQVTENFTQLDEFFGGRDGFARKLEQAVSAMTSVTGSIRTREASLVEQNYRLHDTQQKLDMRMEQIEKRTHAKFSAMQDATSKMQAQLAGMMSAMG